MSLRVVFLDWGGTLARVPAEFSQPWTVWVRVLAEAGQPLPTERVRSAVEAANREVGPRIYEFHGRTNEFWKVFDERVLDLLAVRSERDELEESVQAAFADPSLVRLYPETRRVLTALRNQGYSTALISNHNDSLPRILRRHCLEHLLSPVTYSQEAGVEKPDPKIFRLALLRARCEASDAVHVGDSIEADVEGARKVGIRPVWLNRSKSGRLPGCLMIGSLTELIPLVERVASDPAGTP